MTLEDLIGWHLKNKIPFNTPMFHSDANFAEAHSKIAEVEWVYHPATQTKRVSKVRAVMGKPAFIRLREPLQQALE